MNEESTWKGKAGFGGLLHTQSKHDNNANINLQVHAANHDRFLAVTSDLLEKFMAEMLESLEQVELYSSTRVCVKAEDEQDYWTLDSGRIWPGCCLQSPYHRDLFHVQSGRPFIYSPMNRCAPQSRKPTGVQGEDSCLNEVVGALGMRGCKSFVFWNYDPRNYILIEGLRRASNEERAQTDPRPLKAL